MKFSIKGFFSKCDQICSFLSICSLHFLRSASSIETNQSNDLIDTKYLHNIIRDLQSAIKRKDQ